MRFLGPVLALAVVCAAPANAGTMLYATAASQGRVDGFCVGRDGSLAPTPTVEQVLVGRQPRRLKVVTFGTGNQALYVAEKDRIEVFAVGNGGALTLIGQTRDVTAMDPRDFEVDPVRLRLYVPERGATRIAAYTLDNRGSPSNSENHGILTSCLQGQLAEGLLNVRLDAAKNLLYVTLDSIPGKINIHGLRPNGDLARRPQCLGGKLEGHACRSHADCDDLDSTDDGVCPVQACLGGNTPNVPCGTDADCPGGTCNIVRSCAGGSTPDKLCRTDDDCKGGSCQPLAEPLTCVGGTTPTAVCRTDAECGGGGRCALPAPPSTCKTVKKARPPVSIPFSERRKLQKPKDFLLLDGMLYVEERSVHRLTAFRLQDDGTFCDKAIDKTTDVDEDCTGFDQLPSKKCARKQAKKQRQQCPASQTDAVVQYEALALSGQTILGTQFFRGRVDAYRLKEESRLANARIRLPRGPTISTTADVRTSPVRLLVNGDVLYVADGEDDRISAYRLNDAGVLTSPQPFSRTDVRRGTFPNDVAIAVLPGACD